MSQSLSKVYVHITFSTKRHHPFIDDAIKVSLFEYIGGICKGLDCNPVKIGGHHDHVHILCLLSRKIAQMKLLEEIKKQSSKWIKGIGKGYLSFTWQTGYGAFSVSSRAVEIVRKYIRNQKRHHRTKSYVEELERLFMENGVIEFDPEFYWR